jgi:pimeloyl-ACP methyl ester carboxylesterase
MKSTAFLIIISFGFISIAADTLWGGERTFLTVDGYQGFVIKPPVRSSDKSKPWVWYAPTFINTTTNTLPNSFNFWYLSQLIKKGFWIAGIDVGESYGSPRGREVYSHFYDTLMARYRLNPKACLHPQSRGGLMLYNWASEPGNAAKVDRIAGIFPVGDVGSYPGLSVGLAKTFGMTLDSLTAHLKENNPIDRLKPLAEAGVKILHLHGDEDAIVPLTANSRVIYDRYRAMGGSMTLIVVPHQGHTWIPEFFQSQALLDFMLATATPPLDNDSMIDPFVQPLKIVVPPKPSQSYVIMKALFPGTATARIDILNIQGRRVLSENIASDNGEFSIAWHDLGKTGHPLPAGFYGARITARRSVLQKIIVITR